MALKVDKKLRQLVKGMTSSEKDAFISSLSIRSRSSTYVFVFELLSHEPNISNQELLKKTRIKTEELSRKSKNRLYSKLLDFLSVTKDRKSTRLNSSHT